MGFSVLLLMVVFKIFSWAKQIAANFELNEKGHVVVVHELNGKQIGTS